MKTVEIQIKTTSAATDKNEAAIIALKEVISQIEAERDGYIYIPSNEVLSQKINIKDTADHDFAVLTCED